MSETQDIEVVPAEIEPSSESSGLLVANEKSFKDLQYLSDNIDKIVAAKNKIRLTIMKLAQPGDWSLFGDKAEIGFAGANRIGSTLGINYSNWQSEKLVGHDELGDWFRWEMQCDVHFQGQTIRVFGRAGSRDVFFGKEHGQWKQLHNVNEGNIKMAAMRAAKKEGVKDCLGLHHMDPKFLKENGIVLESASGYAHKSQDEKAEGTQVATIIIRDIRQKSSKPGDAKQWTKFIILSADLAEFSTFERTIAELAKTNLGKKATVNFTTNKYGNDLSSLVIDQK